MIVFPQMEMIILMIIHFHLIHNRLRSRKENRNVRGYNYAQSKRKFDQIDPEFRKHELELISKEPTKSNYVVGL